MSTATGTSTSSRSAYDSVISEGGTRRRVRRPGTKRVTGKEGSPREEEWLVTTMRGLVPSDKLLCTPHTHTHQRTRARARTTARAHVH